MVGDALIGNQVASAAVTPQTPAGNLLQYQELIIVLLIHYIWPLLLLLTLFHFMNGRHRAYVYDDAEQSTSFGSEDFNTLITQLPTIYHVRQLVITDKIHVVMYFKYWAMLC